MREVQMNSQTVKSIKLVEKIKTVRPDFPVIMCTGFSEMINEEKALGMGIKEFITKPYNLKDLSVIVSKYIGNKDLNNIELPSS